MTTPETRPNTGTLPGYLSPAEAAQFANMRIGCRMLTVFEEGDMLALGLTRKDIMNLTPEVLQVRADDAIALSDVFLGS